MVLTDLTTTINTKPNSIVQYSYPTTKMTSRNYTYIPNYASNQNFSASFDNKYISGVCREMVFTRPNHKFKFSHDGELVIKHIKSDNDIFYVVVPIIFKGKNSSQIDILLETRDTKKQQLDLNMDLKNLNSSIICYQINKGNSENTYVFVFEKPISIKNNISSGISTFSAFNGKKSTIRIENGQNIEDEIECEYVTSADDTGSISNKENRKMVTNIFVWVFIVLGLFLCSLYFFTYIAKMDIEMANNIFLGIGVSSFILFVVFISLFTNTSTKKIEYGSMTIFSTLLMLITILARTGRFLIQPTP
jgi:hypothetical protein